MPTPKLAIVLQGGVIHQVLRSPQADIEFAVIDEDMLEQELHLGSDQRGEFIRLAVQGLQPVDNWRRINDVDSVVDEGTVDEELPHRSVQQLIKQIDGLQNDYACVFEEVYPKRSQFRDVHVMLELQPYFKPSEGTNECLISHTKNDFGSIVLNLDAEKLAREASDEFLLMLVRCGLAYDRVERVFCLD